MPEHRASRPQHHVSPELEERRRQRLKQLERQNAALTECSYHEGVRFLKERPGGCPKCEHLFKQGRAPDGRYLKGNEGNPGGNLAGYTSLRRAMKRYASARDAAGVSFQEKIARAIVEGAAEGREPYLSIYLERFDKEEKSSTVNLQGTVETTQPGAPPEIPDDDERDRQVAMILADLQENGGAEDLLSRLVPGSDTEQ